MTSRMKAARENIRWRREHNIALPRKNSPSTVWFYNILVINGIEMDVFTNKPRNCHRQFPVNINSIPDRKQTPSRVFERLNLIRRDIEAMLDKYQNEPTPDSQQFGCIMEYQYCTVQLEPEES